MSTRDITPIKKLCKEIIMHGRHAYATSLDVAEHFGKRHDNVLRDIENIVNPALKSEDWNARQHARNIPVCSCPPEDTSSIANATNSPEYSPRKFNSESGYGGMTKIGADKGKIAPCAARLAEKTQIFRISTRNIRIPTLQAFPIQGQKWP